MTRHPEFHNIDDGRDAIVRQLADGLSAQIYPGDQAMTSVVTWTENLVNIASKGHPRGCESSNH